MSKNVKVNDTTYNGVSTVELPLASGSGKAQFKDVDEITTPSGTVTITKNGTHDVTNYASAVVNVASEGGSGESGTSLFETKSGTFALEADTTSTSFDCGLEYPMVVAITRIDKENIPGDYKAFHATISLPFHGVVGNACYYRNRKTATDMQSNNGAGMAVADVFSERIVTWTSDSGNPICAGTYKWIAVGW